MNINDIFAYLKSLGVLFEVNGENVNLKIPKDLDDEARDLLLSHRNELKLFVSELGAHLQKDPEIKRRSKNIERLPLTSAQKRLFLLDQIQGQSANYNMAATFITEGEINLTLVEQALNIIIARHEILRTVYRHEAGELYQYVLPINYVGLSVSHDDLRRLEAEKQHKSAMAIVKREMSYQFDLGKDLMVRVNYVGLTDESGLLTFIVHHIASDGWSQELLAKEFVEIYHACTLGEVPSRHTGSIQYADYALWLDEVASRSHELQLRYWKQKLEGAPIAHSVPLSYPRPAKSKHSGATVKGVLSGKHAFQLKAIAKANCLTPFTLIHGLFALLLSRYSRTSDILIGTAVAGRTHPQLYSILGFFVNMLPLRVNTRYDSILEYMKHVREVNAEALSNQDVAFDQVVEALGLSGTQNKSPLFQILLTSNTQFTEKPVDMFSVDFSGLKLSPFEAPIVQTKYDLHLDFQLREECGTLCWIYDKELFAQADIESMNSHFVNLLQKVAANGITKYTHPATLPLTFEEADSGIEPASETSTFTVPFDALVHQEIEARTLEAPERIAVKMGGDQLTYQELNERANKLALILQKQYELKEGGLVGILSDRCLEVVIAMVGILKAGGAYVPLDPSYPAVRLKQMTEAAQLVMCAPESLERAEQLGLNACSIDVSLQSTLGVRSLNLKTEFSWKQSPLAYVVFTSGTSGVPKGVMVEHMGLLNTLKHCQSVFKITSETVLYQATSLGFDAATWMIMLALTSGAAVRLAKNGDYIEDLRETNDVSHIFMTPSMLNTLDIPPLHSIQMVISGGERCCPESVRKWLSAGKAFVNAYGPTEVSICSSLSELSFNSEIDIGRPNANMRYYILDEYLRPVPRGGLGELYIAGPGVARGYLGQADVSRAAFLDNPFEMNAESHSMRTYKTGDLVRINQHGDVIFMGRCDKQVKVRGFRIELEEIESNLIAHNQVSKAIVKLVDDNPQVTIVAYVIGSMEQVSAHARLKSFLTQRLPAHMVPDRFIVLKDFPLTRNGKVDVSKLPAVKSLGSTMSANAPHTENEIIVSQAISHVLGVAHVGCEDNFFALGGNSLLAMKLIHHINERSRKKVNLEELFKANNIRELAAELDFQASLRNKKIGRVPNMVDYPLSHAQQGIFFEYQMGNGSSYNVPLLLQFTGELDLSILKETLVQLTLSHQVLRLKIDLIEGEPRQTVLKDPNIATAVKVIALPAASLDEKSWLSDVSEHASQVLSQPLEIIHGEVFNCHYYEHNDGMQVVLLNFSHIIIDGWALEVLKRDLIDYYELIKNGKKINRSRYPFEFVDFVYWQQSNLLGGDESGIDYWRRKLTNLDRMKFSAAYYNANFMQQVEPESVGFFIASEIQEVAAQLASSHKCTEFNIWLMIYALAYSLHEKSNQLAVNVDFANRQLPGTEEIVGLLVNPLLIITDFSEGIRLDQLLEQIVDTCKSAFTFGAVPLKPIVATHLNSQSQCFEQVMRRKFTFDGGKDSGFKRNLREVQELEVDFTGLKYDWSLMLTLCPEGLNGRLMFNRNVHDKKSVDKFISIFSFVSEQVAQNLKKTKQDLSQCWRETLRQRMRSKMNSSKVRGKFRS